MNILSEREQELSEKDIYVSLLGNRSNYIKMSFEGFLDYYSFKVEDEYTISVYNDDNVPYEEYTVNDFSYVPTYLLSCSSQDLDLWIEGKIAEQLKQQEADNSARKENLKQQIQLLLKQLDNLN